MNRFAFASITVFVAASSLAGIVQADTSPTPAAPVVAELTQSGGYTLYPTSSSVQILADGRVVFTRTTEGSPTVTFPLARLEAARVAAIATTAASLTQSALVLDDPNAPQCSDAPWTTIRAANRAGAMIDLAATGNCVNLHRADFAGAPVRDILEGFLAVASLNTAAAQ